MKSVKRLVAAVVMIAALTVPAAAQISFGPKVGVAVNDLKFSEDVISSDNRAGFTGGLMLEVMLPIANLGVDASVMYVHRSVDVLAADDGAYQKVISDKSRDYIEVPINLKWKIGMPIVGNIVTPYLFTGPSFSFLTSKKAIAEAYKNKSFDMAWNFGFGVQVLGKIQVGASYGLGLTKAVQATIDDEINPVDIDGKNRYWTITAAYLF
ncbi:MAG: porin family protein [Muribaculaceae bacterium]|nr:porin family protein [Muribaculaceae bacterium]